ncbi:MAG: hypothetical protein ABL307_04375 [Roseitalea porphyridii]|uniref:hypothetical protein n=1 Tax=Roseitalea porphyridii TaxID=1852022 RepID=UPI0032D9749A
MDLFLNALTDPRAVGTIAGASISAAIVMTIWFLNRYQERKIEENRRKRKTIDVMSALIAEIRSYTSSTDFKRNDIKRAKRSAIEAFEGPYGYRFIPYVPIEKHDRVFEAVMLDIQVLPYTVVHQVVGFYSQMTAITGLQQQLNTDGYRELPSSRRLRLLLRYLDMNDHALKLARSALDALERQISEMDPSA